MLPSKKFADTITGLGEKIEIIAQGGKITKNKNSSKKLSNLNNIMPKQSSPRDSATHIHHHYHINGEGVDFERLFRDTGKYLQPTFDAAQDRAMKEIRGNGWESVLRDTGKYLQPVADAAQDRAIKEIRGNGRRVKGSKAAKEHMARIRAMKKK